MSLDEHASSNVHIQTAAILGIEAVPLTLHLDLGAAGGRRKHTLSEQLAVTALRACDLPIPLHFTTRLLPLENAATPSKPELAIAIALMAATGQVSRRALEQVLIAGELDLTGHIQSTRGIVPIARLAQQHGYRAIVVPIDQRAEAHLVSGIRVLPVATLHDVLAALSTDPQPPPPAVQSTAELPDPLHRVMAIAGAGRHSLLLVGATGSNTLGAAAQLVHFLPPLTPPEALLVATIQSAAGLPVDAHRRPLRMPHHTVSNYGLFGSALDPAAARRHLRPGEITLAHHGVLLLSDFPEFARQTQLQLSTVLMMGAVQFPATSGPMPSLPASPLLVATMTPCPCGAREPCQCSPDMHARYRARVTPHRHLFPLVVRVPNHAPVVARAIPHERIAAARAAAPVARQADAPRRTTDKRAWRLAGTIALLDGANTIDHTHLEEARALVSDGDTILGADHAN